MLIKNIISENLKAFIFLKEIIMLKNRVSYFLRKDRGLLNFIRKLKSNFFGESWLTKKIQRIKTFSVAGLSKNQIGLRNLYHAI
jgi:hypothetical protein